MCEGIINFRTVQADAYGPRDCCATPGSSMDLCEGTLYLAGPDGGTFMSGLELTHTTGNNSVSLAGAGFTADDGNTGNSTAIYGGTVTVKDRAENYTSITSAYIKLAEGTSSEHWLTLDGMKGVIDVSDNNGFSVYIDPNNIWIGSAADKTHIDSNSITIGSLGDKNSNASSLRVDEISATSPKASKTTLNLKEGSLYIDDGVSAEENSTLTSKVISFTAATGDSSYLSAHELSIGNNGTTIDIKTSGLPANTYVYFQEIEVCVNGKNKKAWVLMSDPVDTGGGEGSSDTSDTSD